MKRKLFTKTNFENNYKSNPWLKKRMFILLLLLLCFLPNSGLTADMRTIKFAHSEAEGDICKNPYYMYTSVFASTLESKTGGKFKIQVFPNGQLGDLRSMAEQCARGTLEITGGQNAGLLSSFDPNFQVLEMPYSFNNSEIARLVLHGWFGRELSDNLAARSNLRILSYLPASFRNFSSSKREIRSPADMKGMKMRTMQVPIHMEMVKALGASPTPIPWEELYSALQTGVVDGQENAPYVVLMGKIQEVQKFYTIDRHTANIALILINDKFYKGLSPEDRQAFDYAAREAQFAFLGLITGKENQDIREIEKAGVKIYYPTPAEYIQFRNATREPVLKVLREKVDKKWIDRFFKAVEEAEKQTGLTK